MSEAGIFDEYLVKLGFDSDPAGYAKFSSTLGDAASIAGEKTKSIIESVGKWQFAIEGAFAAVGTAALVTMDKVADADLGFQLFAQKMFIGVDAAKQLSIATEVLGHSLDEIAWNPELHRRFDILLSDQRRMADVMGHGYEPALYNIREIRFQFSRLQDELQFGFLPQLVSKVFDELGGDTALEKLEKLNDWVIDNLPAITSEFSTHLVPVLKDTKMVLGDIAGMLEETGVAFTNLVALFSGDHSIEGTTFNFDHLLTAIDHVSHGLATFTSWITEAERMLAHIVSATAFYVHGDLPDAALEVAQAMKDFTAGERRHPRRSRRSRRWFRYRSPCRWHRRNDAGSGGGYRYRCWSRWHYWSSRRRHRRHGSRSWCWIPEAEVRPVTARAWIHRPIIRLRAGEFVMTMPIQKDDECLLIISDSCIDAWWQSGGVQNQIDLRRHDISDACAIFGIWSQPKKIPNYSTSAAQLRSLDGQTVIEAGSGEITIKANNVTVQAAQEVTISGTSGVKINGTDWQTHTHTGVQSGGSVTGPVAS